MEAFKRDTFISEGKFKVEEANGVVDGQHVLAKVSGPFFVPEGTSRNKRFYSKKLWEKCLAREDVKSKLANKRMFGTIGHDEPIDDKALREGKLSHIMTNLAVEHNGIPGYGECLVLNTPAGQVLNTFLRAGAQLYTSSRALGKFVGDHDGVPAVDEDSYELQTFDFVLDPGFLQANPKLAECYEKFEESMKPINERTLPNKTKEGEYDMGDRELLEKSMNEAASLRTELAGATKEVASIKAQNENLQKAVTESAAIQTALDAYKPLGTVEAIKEQIRKLGVAEAELAKYKAFGSATEVEKALNGAKKFIEGYAAIGTPDEIKEALTKSAKLINEYKVFGPPKLVDRVLEKFKSMALGMRKQVEDKKIADFAKELGVAEATVRKFWGKHTQAEIKAIVSELKESIVPAPSVQRYTKKEVTETAPTGTETKSDPPWKKESLGERLNNTFMKNQS